MCSKKRMYDQQRSIEAGHKGGKRREDGELPTEEKRRNCSTLAKKRGSPLENHLLEKTGGDRGGEKRGEEEGPYRIQKKGREYPVLRS